MEGVRNVQLPYAISYGDNSSVCDVCDNYIKYKALCLMVCDRDNLLHKKDAWRHYECFWNNFDVTQTDINASSICGLDGVKWEDQMMVRQKIQRLKTGYKSPEKRTGTCLYLPRYKVEPSASTRGKCVSCEECFRRGEPKVSLKQKWIHFKCLFYSFDIISGKLEEMKGWEKCSPEEQKSVSDLLGELVDKHEKEEPEPDAPPPLDDGYAEIEEDELDNLTFVKDGEGYTRRNSEDQRQKRQAAQLDDDDAKRKKLEKKEKIEALRKEQLAEQATQMWERRCLLKKMSASERNQLLRENEQNPVEDPERALDILVDMATFGVPELCSKCQDGRIVYNTTKRTYMCTGYVTEYTRCDFTSKNPKRKKFEITFVFNNKHNTSHLQFNVREERLYPKEEEIVAHPKEGRRRTILAAEAFEKISRLPEDIAPTDKADNKHLLKNGTVVDAKFRMATYCHVVKPYEAALSLTDVAENKNSYFKIQLLKEDDGLRYYVCWSWGRVGTEFGGHNSETFSQKGWAIDKFEKLFFEKTHNSWQYRKYFRKLPGLFDYVDTDFSELECLKDSAITPGATTSLPTGVKEVLLSIFDVNKMKMEMKSFNMDVDKMPLGKLSQRQINKAFEVLTQLSEYIAEGEEESREALDATNKFYTLIPHNFGMKRPEPMNNLGIIQEKNRMLNALLDIKLAYDQVTRNDNENIPPDVKWSDPVDINYEKLRCKMEPLVRNGHDWVMIEQYIRNTHGSTHQVHVDLLDILSLDRADESAKFQSGLGGRKLLWHGSARMNYAGILGQGLRIAPPEAPVSGYMFGKGIYFADMFTKSFFYTRAASSGEEVYLLLCDVALGNSYQLLAQAPAMSYYNLPFGYSSIKGVGREAPDQNEDFVHADGFTIPFGQRVVQLHGQHGVHFHLLYNEYIVYSMDQVKMKYLVRLKVHSARHI